MQIEAQIRGLSFPIQLPQRLLEVTQRFDAPVIADVYGAARAALQRSGILAPISPGASVAIAAGSRGIANLPELVRAAVDAVKAVGSQPFVIAAMGSHGGATAEGQRAMLAELGVTQTTVGAEVRATMEVRQIGKIPGGPPLFQDVISATADHVLLVNRIKPHTDFRGPVESGLAKMAVIGLGKQHGAAAMHLRGGDGFARYLGPAARVYEARSNILGGLAVLENARDETAFVEVLTMGEIGAAREEALQARAKTLLASLPFSAIDVLIVRQVGKNISGTGMDTNVIGRLMIPRQPETFGGPDVGVIALLDVTPESHGNASGMGLANVSTLRLAHKIDWTATYTNGVTSGIFGMSRNAMPIIMADDQRAIQVALRCCGDLPENASIVFIEDTLHLERIWVSPNLRAQVEAHPRLSIRGETQLAFGEDGQMVSPWKMA